MARYIDADKLIQALCNTQKTWGSRLGTSWWSHSVKLKDNMVRCIKEQPTADVEEVTYCKDCEWSVKRVRNNDIFPYQCVNTVACGKPRRALDFCSYGMK